MKNGIIIIGSLIALLIISQAVKEPVKNIMNGEIIQTFVGYEASSLSNL